LPPLTHTIGPHAGSVSCVKTQLAHAALRAASCASTVANVEPCWFAAVWMNAMSSAVQTFFGAGGGFHGGSAAGGAPGHPAAASVDASAPPLDELLLVDDPPRLAPLDELDEPPDELDELPPLDVAPSAPASEVGASSPPEHPAIKKKTTASPRTPLTREG
jgi:hypothetical protein